MIIFLVYLVFSSVGFGSVFFPRLRLRLKMLIRIRGIQRATKMWVLTRIMYSAATRRRVTLVIALMAVSGLTLPSSCPPPSSRNFFASGEILVYK